MILPFEVITLFFGPEGVSGGERDEEGCPNESMVFDDAVELLGRPWEEVIVVAGGSGRVSVLGATPRYNEEYGPLP